MKESTAEAIALVDLDGTLCDYNGVMARDLAKLASPDEPTEFPIGEPRPGWHKARSQLIKAQPGWWRNLPRHEPGFQVLKQMRALHFNIHILTKGPWMSSAWKEKVEWCREHVPDASIHISEDKGLIYGKVLMDDWPPYIRRWLQWRPRGLVIMPAWPWNAEFQHPNVIRFDGSNLDEINRRLWEVRQTACYPEEYLPEWKAVSGAALCPDCHEPYRDHPYDLAALNNQRVPFLRICCDGLRVRVVEAMDEG